MLVVVSPTSLANTMVFPIFGGLLHVHCCAAAIILGSRFSVFGCPAVLVVVALSHVVSGGTANTIQFPHISLNGFGIAAPTVYGPKHIAIPSPSVSVGAIYNLNCDHGIPEFTGLSERNPSPIPLNVAGTNADHTSGVYGGVPVGIYPGINNTGSHFPIFSLIVLNIG